MARCCFTTLATGGVFLGREVLPISSWEKSGEAFFSTPKENGSDSWRYTHHFPPVFSHEGLGRNSGMPGIPFFACHRYRGASHRWRLFHARGRCGVPEPFVSWIFFACRSCPHPRKTHGNPKGTKIQPAWYPKQRMFGETTIFYVMIWNHPVETTIKNWMFGIPGGNLT